MIGVRGSHSGPVAGEQMMTRRAVVATAASAAILAGAGPILGQTAHPPGGAAAGTEHAVGINDAGYAPGTVVVAPGHHVTWTNGGLNPHTVTADAGAFDSGTLQPKAEFAFTAPATTGTFTYHCTFHSFMRGALVVSTLTLEGPRRVMVGNVATVRGAAPGAAAGTPVAVEVLAVGAWAPIATATVGQDGAFQVRTPALSAGAALRARIGGDISPTLAVPVAPRVAGRRSGKRALTVDVRPARAGRARLERLNLDTYRWVVVRRVRIGRDGRAAVRVPRAGWFRVTVVPATGLAAGRSRAARFS